MSGDVVIRRPDDFHVHLRQGRGLKHYTRDVAGVFARALVMPNTIPPIDTPDRLNAYRRLITRAAGRVRNDGDRSREDRDLAQDSSDRVPDAARRSKAGRAPADGFTPIMTFKLGAQRGAAEIRALREAGAAAGKYYPPGVTTNSEGAPGEIEALFPLLEAMQELDMVLCIHGETPGAPALDRERRFLPNVRGIVERFPRLRVVLEHVSSKEGVALVASLPGTVAATITVHHLLYTLDDLLADKLEPHLFCKPVLKTDADRAAIRDMVLSGNPKFFYGSDSAPHPRRAKEAAHGAAGVYSMPVALPLLCTFFTGHGAIDRLEPFVADFGAAFYRMPRNEGTIHLTRRPWTVPQVVHGVVPLGAGERLEWAVGGGG